MSSLKRRRGLLFLNLGTPASPSVHDVKTYLSEFLMDPYVISLPHWLRWLLVHGLILRNRPQKSAEAYKSIWTESGSPLLVESQKFLEAVRNHRNMSQWGEIELAMRYGSPSISEKLALFKIRGISEILLFPLYPQYAESSFRTAVEMAIQVGRSSDFRFDVVPPFYSDSGFLGSEAKRVSETISHFKADYVLFSFHGLPRSHIQKVGTCRQHCFKSPRCCDTIQAVNAHCYRAQCAFTAREVAHCVNLKDEQWSFSFQSRLGPGWVQPFTDKVIPELAQKGIRRLAVTCPSFTTDCLETLEEIGIRARRLFIEAGGEDLVLVPSLNDDSQWVDAVATLANAPAFQERRARHLPFVVDF